MKVRLFSWTVTSSDLSPCFSKTSCNSSQAVVKFILLRNGMKSCFVKASILYYNMRYPDNTWCCVMQSIYQACQCNMIQIKQWVAEMGSLLAGNDAKVQLQYSNHLQITVNPPERGKPLIVTACSFRWKNQVFDSWLEEDRKGLFINVLCLFTWGALFLDSSHSFPFHLNATVHVQQRAAIQLRLSGEVCAWEGGGGGGTNH